MVVGNTPSIHASLFGAGATIPSWIASSFREATSVGLHRSALLALAVVLVGVTFAFAALSRLLVRRVRGEDTSGASSSVDADTFVGRVSG
jgi:ABC-type phosphate transport system permease subunit